MRREISSQHMRVKRSFEATPVLEERDPSLINLPIPLPSIPILTPLLEPLIGGSNQESPAPDPAPTQPTSTNTPPASTPSGSSGGSSGGDSGGSGGSGSSGGGSGSSGSGSSGSGSSGSSGSGSGSSGSGSSGSGSTGSGGGSSSSGSGSSGSGNGSGGGSSSSSGSSGSGNGSGGGSSSSGSSGSSGSGSGTSGNGSSSSGNGGGGSGSSSSGGASGGSTTTTSGGSTGNGGNGATSGSTATTGGEVTPSGSSGAATTSKTSAASQNGGSVSPSSGSSLDINEGAGKPTQALSALSPPASVTSVIAASGTHPASTVVLGVTSTGAAGTALTLSGGVAAPTGTSAVNANSGATAKHGLSGGAIAGIVIVVLFAALGLIVVGLRRRSIAKRDERRDRWFGSGFGASKTSVNSGSGRSGNGTVGSGDRSARSSFATNIDHGLQLRVDSPAFTQEFDVNALTAAAGANAPEFPPMAEVRNGSLINTTRFSSSSSNSSHSTHSQYLDVPNMPIAPPEVTSPMSVRPFSPSEAFSFPKPPAPSMAGSSETDWLNRSYPNSPIADSIRTLTPQKVSANRQSANMGTGDRSFAAAMAQNPFSDPASETSPFTDDAAVAPSAASPTPNSGAAPVEVVRRPFAPTLEDELAVVPGDVLRIVKVFDDGWAFAENVSTFSKGLIPIDCMREAGEELPAFLASKRVSSMISESGINYGDAV